MTIETKRRKTRSFQRQLRERGLEGKLGRTELLEFIKLLYKNGQKIEAEKLTKIQYHFILIMAPPEFPKLKDTIAMVERINLPKFDGTKDFVQRWASLKNAFNLLGVRTHMTPLRIEIST